jgi:hypothetical protein
MPDSSLIEAKLQTLSSAVFQQLGDAYLRRTRPWPLHSWGLMVGADKDKTGVPDAYCQLASDGRYVLVAYTTTSPAKLAAKLSQDVTDCLGEAQHLFTPAQVERIVLVCNNRVSPAVHARLVAQARGYQLELIGVDEVVQMILDYPPLAIPYLDLDLGRGQLLQAAEFVAAYSRQLGATPLTNHLYGREAEEQQLRTALATHDVVLVTGGAGVGKTQLVVTAAQAYCEEAPDQRQIYFVYDKNSADFALDLQLLLAPGRELVVVADDANRVSPHVRTLLAEQRLRRAGQLKVVATVRDYARDLVRQLTQHSHTAELPVERLANEHLLALVRGEPYLIRNPLYLDRILELSQGRPRLAVMAAIAARESEDLSRLHDIADLYKQYFGPILEQISQQPEALLQQRVLALLHLFGNLRRDDLDRLNQIHEAFGISPDEVWRTLVALDNVELAEVLDGRVARPADQILSNYLFYQVFFGDKPSLSFAGLLQHFFPIWSRRIKDAVVPVINDFDYQKLEPKIKPALLAWLCQPDVPDVARWQLYEMCWPYLRPQILRSVRTYLDRLPWLNHDEVYQLPIAQRTYSPGERKLPLLDALEPLCEAPISEQSLALSLLLELAAKLPQQFGRVVTFLRPRVMFNGHEYNQHGLHTPELIIRILVDLAADTQLGNFAQQMLGGLLPQALATANQGVRNGPERGSVAMCMYTVPFQDDTRVWRQQLWQQLTRLCTGHPDRLVNLFGAYFQQRQDIAYLDSAGTPLAYEWQRWDAQFIVPLLQQLDPGNFQHAQLVLRYYYWLDRRLTLPEIQPLKARFSGGLVPLYDLLVYHQPHRRRSEKGIAGYYGDEAQAFHLTRLKSLFYKTLTTYQKLLSQFHQLVPQLEASAAEQACQALAVILGEACIRNQQLGAALLHELVELGNPTSIIPVQAIRLLAEYDAEGGYQLLVSRPFGAHHTWRWRFLASLPAETINANWLAELYTVIEEGDLVYYDFTALTAYEAVAPDLYPQLLRRVLQKAKDAGKSFDVFHLKMKLFVQHFAGPQLKVLQDWYLWQCETNEHYDGGGKKLACLVGQDPGFLLRYNRTNFKRRSFLPRYDSRPLRFLWESATYQPQLYQMVADLASRYTRFEERQLADALLPSPHNETQRANQQRFLGEALVHFRANSKAIGLLFTLIREQMPDQLLSYFRQLLALGIKDLELLKSIRLFPSARTTGRSWVPVLEDDKRRWEEILSAISTQSRPTPALHEFHLLVLEEIDKVSQQIAAERERDFAAPY